MLRWTIYILRMLANLLGDPVDATMCQVCEGGERKDGLVSQPVRARCGYRLCLTKLQATNPTNDASHLDLIAVGSGYCKWQPADRPRQ